MNQQTQISDTNQISWLVLMQMRPPLLLLVSVYSVSVLGMVLIPGPVENGVATHLSFFHAIYFVSYISTTIGLGEIPYEFSSAQRLWSIFIMYMTVVVWIYAIGTMLALLQNPAYRQILEKKRFSKHINRLQEPFYIICGYDEVGRNLTEVFTRFHIKVVIIDDDPEKINHLKLNDQRCPVYIPRLCADACIPENLITAGLQHPMCTHLIAVTGTDESNLKITISGKLKNKTIQIVSRADYPETKLNMASFGTEHIIDPLHAFSNSLSLALQRPNHYILQTWLSGMPQQHFHWPRRPPHGLWIICGYGRLGKRIVQTLVELGLPGVVIDIKPLPAEDACPMPFICAPGLDAEILQQAKIKTAVGIIAGTDNDVNNLSITITAREINPALFIVARQNLKMNELLFAELNADLVLYPHEILSHQIRTELTMPLLHTFFDELEKLDNEEVLDLLRHLAQHFDNTVTPEIWTIKMRQQHGIYQALTAGHQVQIKHLLPEAEDEKRCLPLLLKRDDQFFSLPNKNFYLQGSDKLLFCGLSSAYPDMLALLNNKEILHRINHLPMVSSPILHTLFKH